MMLLFLLSGNLKSMIINVLVYVKGLKDVERMFHA